jgi:hypothetical protein
MDPIDDELKKGLASGPLIRHGFSEKLKKRIEKRVEGQNQRSGKFKLWFGGVGTALITAVILLSVNWQQAYQHEAIEIHKDATADNESAPMLPAFTDHRTQEIHSAVLIGLREDHGAVGSSSPYSTYRTVLLAPERGALRTIAEGDGILMPYKMDFMKIVTQSQTIANEESYTLQAALAAGGSKSRLQPVSQPTKPLKLSEKLLFAGNRYLALSQTVRQQDQGKASQYEYVWIKELEDLFASKTKSISPMKGQLLQDPHLTLKKLYGDSVQSSLTAIKATAPQEPGTSSPASESIDKNGESWTISRRQGEWIPQVASYSGRAEEGGYHYQLKDIPLKLPETVVSYDQLAVSWNEIRQLRPNAKDAFSSPNQEMVGVVSDEDIVVYPIEGRLIPVPLLSLRLDPDESIVMIQWAVNEPYIEQWKQKGKQLLGDY